MLHGDPLLDKRTPGFAESPTEMGPASLPTPLSPMRGRVSEDTGTWHPMFPRSLRSEDRSDRFRHRRSHRHPDPPSARPGSAALRSEDLRLPGPAALQRAVPRSGCLNGRLLERRMVRFRSEDHRLSCLLGKRPGWPDPWLNITPVAQQSQPHCGHEGLPCESNLLTGEDRLCHVFPKAVFS